MVGSMFTPRGATPVLFPPPRGMTPVPFLPPPVQFVRTPRGMKPAQFTDYNWPTSSLHQDARILTPQVLLVQQVSLPQRGFPQTGAVQPTAVDFTMAARPLLSLEDFCSTLPGGGAPSNNPLGSSQGNLMHALSYAAFASTLPPPPGDAQYIMQSHINQLPQIQAGHAFTHHTFMPQAPEAHFPLLQFATKSAKLHRQAPHAVPSFYAALAKAEYAAPIMGRTSSNSACAGSPDDPYDPCRRYNSDEFSIIC
mmetsp:Transcript_73058/g.118505  ORF Transcript_73058/g.118505 Transcript_73058/m.118505 type:complete len:252 (-) Transcript_73058:418-1173(-)